MRKSLCAVIVVAGCGAVSANRDDAGIDARVVHADAAVDAPPAIQHLYLPNDSAGGGISQFTLPLTSTSTANFVIPLASSVAAIPDPMGNLIGADNTGHVYVFDKPLSATSTAAVTFSNGTNGGLVLTSTGTLIPWYPVMTFGVPMVEPSALQPLSPLI